MQLGYSPRLTVTHTSKLEAGQIFIPQVNRALMVGSIALVLYFRSSSALASAYGIAVTGTMVITTILFTQIARRHWGWSRLKAFAFLTIFLTIDGAFLFANVIKIESGGWFPLLAALAVYLMMTTWNHGRRALHTLLREGSLPIGLFLDDVKRRQPPRVPGTAVFMTSDESGAPVVLLHHLKHNKVLHDQVILLSVVTDDVPEVAAGERVNVEPLGEGFYRVIARYGFMQQPNVPSIFPQCAPLGVKLRPNDTSYFLGREQLIPTGRSQNVALAEEALRHHVAKCAVGDAVLWTPAQSGGRARSANRVLMRARALASLALGLIATCERARAQGPDSAAEPADPHAAQPERPTVATHAGTVAPAWVEIEAGVEHDDLDGAHALLTPTVLKFGIAPRRADRAHWIRSSTSPARFRTIRGSATSARHSSGAFSSTYRCSATSRSNPRSSFPPAPRCTAPAPERPTWDCC